ncbi:glycosyltransferase family 4 protein [Tsuneonella sp. SYSU-LHT278]|uniref:glycosyltransferase family 4 protein n=1 Tax=Tsuneonella sediminis TaxID=3416089 RepID=UPI003F791420
MNRRVRPRIMFLGLRGIGGIQGGVETHVSELVRNLPYAREELEVIGRRPYRRTDLQNDPASPIIRWLPAWRHPFVEAIFHSLLGVLYAAVRRPHLLHIHAIGPNIVTPLARLLGLRVISTHHGEDYRREKWGRVARLILRLGERNAVCSANACISISPTVTNTLEARFNRQVFYIPNGVSPLPPLSAGETLARMGLRPGEYVLNVARLVPEKRQIDLINAFRASNLRNAKLVLVGGADHHTDYTKAVHELACGDPQIVLAGHLSGPPLVEVFSNAALFCLPSSHEGLPIVLLEALSYNLPVLLSDLPVYRAMGMPAQCLVPVGDVQSLAAKLSTSFPQYPTRADWQETLKPYRWRQIAKETAKIYERVICKK